VSTHRIHWLIVLSLAGAAFGARAGAADVDRYLPDESNFIAALDFHSLVDAPIFKNNAPEFVARYGIQVYEAMAAFDPQFQKSFKEKRFLLKQILTNRELVSKMLKEWGEAVASVTVAGNSDDPQSVLLVVRGDFTAAGMKTALEGGSFFSGKTLKTEPLGRRTLYRINGLGADKEAVNYGVLLEDGVCVFSPSRDSIEEAAAKADGKRETKLSKRMRAVLDGMDRKQTLWLCGVSRKEGEEADSFHAVVSVAKDVQLTFAAQARSADAARKQADEMNQALDQAKELLAQLAESAPPLKPLSEQLKSFKLAADDSTVVGRLTVTQMTLDQMLNAKP